MNIFLKLQIMRGYAYRERIARRTLRDLSDCINLPDSYLLKNCALNRAVFHQVLKILEPVVPKTQRSNGIPFPLKVLVTLAFLASGSHQKSVSKDFNINISQKSVSRIIRVIVEGFSEVLDNWVVFPASASHRDQIKEGFYRKYHFPETIGCLDGTSIEIVCPRDDVEAFYDRKGQYSINAQFICDADMKIIAVCCRFGGAANNAYIWNKMNIRQFIENVNRQGESGWLVGTTPFYMPSLQGHSKALHIIFHEANFYFRITSDNKYPQRAWLMTPVGQASQGTPESQYNHFHGRTKTCIDKCISKLKGRWQCLHKRPLHYTPQRAAKIINACAVLHNLCVIAGLPGTEPYINSGQMTISNVVSEIPDDNVNDFYIGIEMRRQLSERIYYSV